MRRCIQFSCNEYRVSVGAFDLDKLALPIMLKIAEGDEATNLLGVKGLTKINKGEVYILRTSRAV